MNVGRSCRSNREREMSRFNVGLTGDDGSDRSSEVEAFADHVGLERLVPGRYSVLLTLPLFASFYGRHLNPYKVLSEIETLERSGVTQMKGATPFTGPHLRGLWHQHFLPDGIPTLAHNVRNGLKEYGLPCLEERIRQVQASGKYHDGKCERGSSWLWFTLKATPSDRTP
jgi:hypothetical protein